MIEAMILAGLAKGTQEAYVQTVWQLAAYYRRAPDQLSEEEVRRYLLDRFCCKGDRRIPGGYPSRHADGRCPIVPC